MSDLISRQAAIKAIDDLTNCYNGYSDTYDKAYIIGVLEELPSALTRCKDCKHYQFADNRAFGFPVKRCEFTGFEDVDDNDFCSRGETI